MSNYENNETTKLIRVEYSQEPVVIYYEVDTENIDVDDLCMNSDRFEPYSRSHIPDDKIREDYHSSENMIDVDIEEVNHIDFELELYRNLNEPTIRLYKESCDDDYDDIKFKSLL
jgi:hypothetical protein